MCILFAERERLVGGEKEIEGSIERERDFWEEKRKKISWGKRKKDWWGRIRLSKITT